MPTLRAPRPRRPGRPSRRATPGPARIVVLGDLVLDVVRRAGSAARARDRRARSACRSSRAGRRRTPPAGWHGSGRGRRSSRRSAGTRWAAPSSTPCAVTASRCGSSAWPARGPAASASSSRPTASGRSSRTARPPSSSDPTTCEPNGSPGPQALHLPMYSFLGEPLGEAARRAVSLARDAGAFVSVDLASIGPLLELGRPAAAALIEEVAPDLIFATAGEAQALLGRRGRRQPARPRTGRRRQARPAGRHRPRPRRRGEPPLRSRDRTPHRHATRPAPATPSTPGFLVGWFAARAAGRSLPAALQRAAVTGHRAAARQLSTPRPELPLA